MRFPPDLAEISREPASIASFMLAACLPFRQQRLRVIPLRTRCQQQLELAFST